MARKEYLINDCPEYYAKITDDYGVLFLHLDFKRWSTGSYRKLLEDWKAFRLTVRGHFFALANNNEINKWRKFVERLGFVYFKDLVCPDGEIRPCYVNWDKTYG